MPITFHPYIGAVLMCDFNTGFKEPEMVKCRPVVVLSHNKRQALCTVVPLSTTEPTVIEACHHEMSPESLPILMADERTWAKCDMITTVGFWRLERVRDGKNKATGARIYSKKSVTGHDLRKIHECVLHVLELKHLQWPQ